MTARTHDLFAATAGICAIAFGSLPTMSLGTAVVAGGVIFLGGMAPDLDEPGAQFWQRIPTGAGTILGKIVSPIFGSHRFVSHSLVGMTALVWLFKVCLEWAQSWLLVDINIVVGAFVLGIASHFVGDGLTKEGIPLLWPLPLKFGFPPFKFMRITTGGWMERTIFVGLVFLNIWIIRNWHEVFLGFLRSLV